jgi:hypothetical protein
VYRAAARKKDCPNAPDRKAAPTKPQTPISPAQKSPPLQPPLPSELHPPAPALVIRYEDQLLTRRQAAEWLGVTVDCLSRWALAGRGPRALRVGQHKTAYKVGSILEWLDRQSDAPTIPCKWRNRQRAQKQALSA